MPSKKKHSSQSLALKIEKEEPPIPPCPFVETLLLPGYLSRPHSTAGTSVEALPFSYAIETPFHTNLIHSEEDFLNGRKRILRRVATMTQSGCGL